MSKKRFKINRYTYEWGGQKKRQWRRVLSMALLIGTAALAGWLAYEPVSQWIMGAQTNTPPPQSASESLSQSQSVQQPPASSQAPPETEQSALPASFYYLPNDVVRDTARLQRELESIKSRGGKGVLFDLKDDSGWVLYKSALPEVAGYLVQAEQSYDLPAVLAAIKAAGLSPVGRLYTFRDSRVTMATAMSGAAVKYMEGPVNWLDNSKANGGRTWLNPNNADARGYILQLVTEVTAMGVDDLLLDGVQFPTGLSLHLANFGGDPDRSQLLGDFVAAAAAAAQTSDARVYPVIRLEGAMGLNQILYGTQPQQLATAAGGAVLDIRPEQFGVGVTTDTLTLTKPLQTPYESLTTALAATGWAVQTSEGDETPLELAAMVQCYTATSVDAAANQTYGAAEVQAQVRAATEAGMASVLYYSPSGSYPG